MAADLVAYRLTANPAVWQPRALYFIKGEGAEWAEVYITGNDAIPVGIANTEAVVAVVDTITIDLGDYDPGDLTVYFENGMA